MSYLVLARKYRPQRFDEVVQQPQVTRTLTNAIASDRVAHANLFAGPRGTGKTTVARLLAKSMNCEKGPSATPCNSCRSCREITSGNAADVFEIDGASNNGVDHIRDVRENIQYMPAHSRYKIYIIDEVHMLSTPAFNALLKTLEEPPAHVLFMFATTEVHKVPITILSRCQRHDFRLLSLDAIARHLGDICKRENISVEPESLALIAREAGGSMRDGLSLLDQVMSYCQGEITAEKLLDVLGVVDRKTLFDLADALLARNPAGALALLHAVYRHGHNLQEFYGELIAHFRNLLVMKLGPEAADQVEAPPHEIEHLRRQANQVSITDVSRMFDLLYAEEPALRFSSQPRLAIETVFFKLHRIPPSLPIETLIEKIDLLRNEAGAPCGDRLSETQRGFSGRRDTAGPHPDPPRKRPDLPESSASLTDQSAMAAAPASPDKTAEGIWDQLVEKVSAQQPALGASLAGCRLKHLADQRLEIEVAGSEFSLKMIRRDKNRQTLKQICSEVFGRPIQIKISSAEAAANGAEKRQKTRQIQRLKQEAMGHPLVTDALEIFNGKVIDVRIPKEVSE